MGDISNLELGHNPLTATNTSFTNVKVELRVYAIVGIDSVRQEFECNFRLFLRWNADKVGMDWVPEFYFLNILQAPFNVDGPLIQHKFNQKTSYMEGSYQVRMIGKFYGQMDFKTFPFDQQCLPIQVRIPRTDRQKIDSVECVEVTKGAEELQEMVDWKILSSNGEVKYESPNSPNRKPTVSFQVHVARRYQFWVLNAIIPLSLVYGLLWFGFAIPYEVINRLGYVLSVLGLVLFFKFIISARVPEISYTTILDNWMLICFANGILIAFGLGISCLLSSGNAKAFDTVILILSLALFLLGTAKCTLDARHAIQSQQYKKTV